MDLFNMNCSVECSMWVSVVGGSSTGYRQLARWLNRHCFRSIQSFDTLKSITFLFCNAQWLHKTMMRYALSTGIVAATFCNILCTEEFLENDNWLWPCKKSLISTKGTDSVHPYPLSHKGSIATSQSQQRIEGGRKQSSSFHQSYKLGFFP